MKHILSLLLLTISLQLSAQKPFEGTLHFQLNFLNASPEMEMAKAMLPTGFVLKLKGENSRLSTEGGMMAAMFGDVVTHAASKKTFFLNDAAKTVTLISDQEQLPSPAASDYEITEGNDPRSIMGYDCKHYVVTSKVDASIRMEFWMATALRVKLAKTSSTGLLVQSGMYGLEGLALRSVVDQLGMKMVVEATAITPEILPAALFEMPKAYKVIDRMPAMFDFGGGND
jgi:hypothetical protein